MLITLISGMTVLAATASEPPPLAVRIPCYQVLRRDEHEAVHPAVATFLTQLDDALARIDRREPQQGEPCVRYRDAALDTSDDFERETLLRTARDQYARGHLGIAFEIDPPTAAASAHHHAHIVMCEVDTSNLGFLHSRLEDAGYPFQLTGIAREAFNVLLLHADAGPDIQLMALNAIEPEIETDPVLRRDFLRIHRRWTNNTGGPGYFGERGECAPDGQFHLYGDADSATLNERRTRAGMASLSDYAAAMSHNCAQP